MVAAPEAQWVIPRGCCHLLPNGVLHLVCFRRRFRVRVASISAHVLLQHDDILLSSEQEVLNEPSKFEYFPRLNSYVSRQLHPNQSLRWLKQKKTLKNLFPCLMMVLVTTPSSSLFHQRGLCISSIPWLGHKLSPHVSRLSPCNCSYETFVVLNYVVFCMWCYTFSKMAKMF